MENISRGLVLYLVTIAMLACTPVQTNESVRRSGDSKNESSKAAGTNDADKADTDGSDADGSEEDSDKEEAEEEPVDLVEKGNLMVQWIHGSADCNQDQNPPIQVHEYNPSVFILRQNKCLNFEAPFIYLIMGQEKALLLDTGATRNANQFPLQQTVEGLLANFYQNQRQAIELVVAHSHGHGDHVAGDDQFQGQPQTTVVGTAQAAVASFFNIANWPLDQVEFDLGNRVLDIIPIPGHQDAHIAIYDRKTQLLLTGDSLYPGRLYVNNWETYRNSVKRLLEALDGNAVSFVMGAHIEMSDTPGVDYPIGTTFQPNEHQLALSLGSLQLLNTELQNIGVNPMRKVTDSFIIAPQ